MANGARRAKGCGSIAQAKTRDGKPRRNVWLIRHSWTDRVTGERRRVNETVHGTKGEAAARLEELRRAQGGGLDLDGAKTTFAEFARDWQAAREESGELGHKALDESRRSVKCLTRYVGDMALSDIDPATVERAIRAIRNDKRRQDGTTVKNSTILKYFRHFKQIMQRACDYDCIMRNPCARVKPPKPEEPDRRALSEADARRLLETIGERERADARAFAEKERRREARGEQEARGAVRGLGNLAKLQAVRLALATGMRCGEILGLTWAAVDTRAGYIEVRQSLTSKGAVKAPKTEAGRRLVWIDRDTRDALDAWRAFEADYLQEVGILRAGEGMRGDLPVICSDIGGHASIDNFGRWWRRFREENGFPGLKLHELRHTQGTLLIASGMDVKTVQARLGHASPNLTLKWYVHPVDENDKRAAQVMGGILSASDASRQNRVRLS